MARWILDESSTPLVLHLDRTDDPIAPDFDSLLEQLRHLKQLLVAAPRRVVFDLTGAQPDPRRRQRFVTWMREEGWAMRHRVDAFALVAPSAVLRGAITAIRWFFTDDATPTEVFETREAAIAWARARR